MVADIFLVDSGWLLLFPCGASPFSVLCLTAEGSNMGLQKGPIYLGEQFLEHRHGQMVGAFFLFDVKRHLLVLGSPFFVIVSWLRVV